MYHLLGLILMLLPFADALSPTLCSLVKVSPQLAALLTVTMSAGQPLKALCWEDCISQVLDTVTLIFGPLAYRGSLPECDTTDHGGLITCVTPLWHPAHLVGLRKLNMAS